VRVFKFVLGFLDRLHDSIITHSQTHCHTAFINFKLFKIKYKIVAVIVCSVSGQFKSPCCNLHESVTDQKKRGGISTTLIAIIKSTHCMQIEITETRIRILIQNSVTDRVWAYCNWKGT
jgi:hypothetical protein